MTASEILRFFMVTGFLYKDDLIIEETARLVNFFNDLIGQIFALHAGKKVAILCGVEALRAVR